MWEISDQGFFASIILRLRGCPLLAVVRVDYESPKSQAFPFSNGLSNFGKGSTFGPYRLCKSCKLLCGC